MQPPLYYCTNGKLLISGSAILFRPWVREEPERVKVGTMKKLVALLCVIGLLTVCAFPMLAFESSAGKVANTKIQVHVHSIKLHGANTEDNYFDEGYWTLKDYKLVWVPNGAEFYWKVSFGMDHSHLTYLHTSSTASEGDSATWSDSADYTISQDLEFGKTQGHGVYAIKISVYDDDPSGYETADVNPEVDVRGANIWYSIENNSFQYQCRKTTVTQDPWSDWFSAGTHKTCTGNGDTDSKADAELQFTIVSDNRDDVTPPTISKSQSPSAPNGQNGWYKSAASTTLKITGDDQWTTDECGIGYYTGEPVSPPLKQMYLFFLKEHTFSTDSMAGGAEGIKKLTYHAYDPSGHKTADTLLTFKVDKTVPTITDLTGPATIVTAETIDFSWAGTDAVSGIKDYEWWIDSGTPQTTTESSVSNDTPEDGHHTFSVRGRDMAGNSMMEPAVVEFDVDRTGSSVTGLRGPPGWVTTNEVSFSWSGIDPGSGVLQYHYKIDSNPEQTTTDKQVTLETPSDGLHKFFVQVEDVAHNLGAWISVDFRVDRTAPTLSGLTGPEDWVTEDTCEFSWTGADATSLIKRYVYTIDDGDTKSTTDSTLVLTDPPEGLHTFNIKPEDNAGNLGTLTTVDFKVDLTAPSVTEIEGEEGWISTEETTFELTGDDSSGASDSSGIDHFTYTIDDGVEKTAANPLEIDVPADGEHTLKVKATDVAGNTGEFASFDFKVDRTAPSVKDLVAPEGWVFPDGVSFDWVGEDAGGATSASGVDHYIYTLDDGDELVCASPPLELNGLGDGEHTLRVKAVDGAGNIGDAKSVKVKVDQTPPEMTSLVVPTDWVVGETIEVTCVATDSGSGLDHYMYKLDDGTEQQGSSPLTIDVTTDGIHTISVRGVDVVGNIGEPMNKDIKVDQSMPKVTAATLPGGTMKTKTRDVVLTVSLDDNDEGSFLKGVRYSIAGGEWHEVLVGSDMHSGSLDITLTLPNTPGDITVGLKALDNAENLGSEYTAEIDYAPPEEKKSMMLPIILIIIVVIVVMLLLFMRSGRGRALMSRQSSKEAPRGAGPGMVGGTGGAGVSRPPVYAPPAPAPAPAPASTVRPMAAAGGAAAGTFRVLNVKAQCPSCGTAIERGSSAYVCSCGTAVHEQCAGRLKVCPSCNRDIRLG
jgi:hypothetical protein